MNIQQAMTKASKIAKAKKVERFIVREDGQYFVASYFDLETVFNGATPVLCVNADGSVESAHTC